MNTFKEYAREGARQQDSIMSSWRGDDVPKVSIKCITFNHEPFIEKALKGFLSQVTDFPFEIIVHDDASTDNTAKIIKRYQEMYPRLIKAIYQKENQYSQGNKPGHMIAEMCQGKYVAMCEGDDYWTDPHKLQKQVGFLDANPDFVISCHNAVCVDDMGKEISGTKLPSTMKRDFSKRDLIQANSLLLTMSWMYRNIKIERPRESRMVLNGDNFFISLIGHYGKGKYHDDIAPSVYHMHSGGVWSSLSTHEKLLSKINTWYWLHRYYLRIGQLDHAEAFWKKYLDCVTKAAAQRPRQLFYYATKNSMPTGLRASIRKLVPGSIKR